MMSSISLHPVPEFNPDTEVGASLATRWKKWLADFDMYLAASGIINNARKRALLLYQAGARVREIFAQLEDTGNAEAFDTAKQKLTAYFEPQTNKRYDVYVFRKTMQWPNETLDQYYTRLRAFADPFEFADLDLELEEQIIISGSSSRIRKLAFRDPKYDLKAMLLDGRRDEISKFQSKEIERKPDSREETNQVTTKSQTCRTCGCSHSHTSLCPAKGKECYYCGKPNHFENVCRGNRRIDTSLKSLKTEKLLASSTIRILDHLSTLNPNLRVMSICILFAVNRLLGLRLESLFSDIRLI